MSRGAVDKLLHVDDHKTQLRCPLDVCTLGTAECKQSVYTAYHETTSATFRWDSQLMYIAGPFLLSISVFVCSFFVTFLFGSVRQIKLAIRQLLGASYRIVLYIGSDVRVRCTGVRMSRGQVSGAGAPG